MAGPLEAARAALAERCPSEAAAACGFDLADTPGGAAISGSFIGRPFVLATPALSATWSDDGTPVPPHLAALIVYHLAVADGTRPSGEWTSFADLPNGSFYVSAWRGYTPDALVRHFGDRTDDLTAAAAVIGCEHPALPGDLALGFTLMPRIPVAVVYWHSDDEFPTRADVLFDATASHQLPTDCCAILTKQLVVALIAADPCPPPRT